MIGTTISHYRILEKLGGGGMGVVYRAEDIKLRRPVALKFLPQELTRDAEAKRRFIHEAQAASALQHHNICTIHEIDETPDGQIFICMDCYDGETLKEKIARGPMRVEEAVEVALQIAEGLSKAHEAGMVHRDVKPANIMVTKDGVVKIVDFGLAKLAGTKVTKTGTTLGTAQYMSPEQARGEQVDQRADIWSLGIVLYEMLTGKHAFPGEYEQATLYAIMNEEPEPVTALRSGVPMELERIVKKCLEKNPAERHQTAADLIADLQHLRRTIGPDGQSTRASRSAATRPGRRARRWLWAAPVLLLAAVAIGIVTGIPSRHPAPTEKSIAVLPFVDMSPQQDQEYFCEGIAEELLNALVQIEGLRVAARTSSAQFKDKAVDVRAIGRKLGVKSVLEGSVRKSGDRLRITAQLINVEDGYHFFSEKYDRTADDIFTIQDEISLAIVDKLKVKLLKGEESRLTKRHTENEEAYRLYLQGRYFWNRRHEGGMQRGLEYFQKAIAVDPEYALPYSGIADCYFSLGFLDFLAPKAAFGKCKEAALKALALDPDLAEAHASLAVALQFFDWDPAGAEAEFRRAIALNPNYATAHFFYGFCLTAMGRFDEAIAEHIRAMELDPIQPSIRAAHAYTLWVAGRDDEAIASSRALTEFDPNFFLGWLMLGDSCAKVGRFAEAETAFRKADDLTGGASTLVLASMGYALGQAGKRNEARLILNRLLELRESKYASARYIAQLYWLFDEQDEAFEWLERGIEERDHWLCYAKYLPTLQPMRSDPRFREILRRLGLDASP
jgi:serine/threonine protein kinase/tetratricopeptide (TPR) repeat protein